MILASITAEWNIIETDSVQTHALGETAPQSRCSQNSVVSLELDWQ